MHSWHASCYLLACQVGLENLDTVYSCMRLFIQLAIKGHFGAPATEMVCLGAFSRCKKGTPSGRVEQVKLGCVGAITWFCPVGIELAKLGVVAYLLEI
ncbi:hypothetical protein [Pseudophaeobacter sp.]|uniref:hypothetical protein n=1 Tax=Pseudophaeobacter sp. TaxID=1971739 RepID=UPI0032979F60